MSLASWITEFYKVPASTPKDELSAVKHCIRKWEGLRKEDRRRHGVVVQHADLTDKGVADFSFNDRFGVDSSTCALCVMHDGDCSKCILATARDGMPCYENDEEEDMSPYDQWTQHSDPEPMIFWLVKAKSDLT